MVVLIVWLWDRDRKGRIKAQEQSDERYEQIVKRLQAIIEGNTTADDDARGQAEWKDLQLPDGFRSSYGGGWTRTWMSISDANAEKARALPA